MNDEIKNEKNENPEWEKGDGNSFLEVLQLLGAMNRERENREREMQQSNLAVAKLEKSMFDSYVAVGFSEGQALDLTKNKINALFRSVGPRGDK